MFALLLFALATWILIMAWMSRHAYYGGPYPFPARARLPVTAPEAGR